MKKFIGLSLLLLTIIIVHNFSGTANVSLICISTFIGMVFTLEGFNEQNHNQ